MYSASCGKLECIMTITKAGADLNVQDSQGKTAGNLNLFLSCMHVEKISFIEPIYLQHGAKYSVFDIF